MKELTFPRIMMVSDDPITKENPGEQRVVWAYNPNLYYPFLVYPSNIKTLKDVDNITNCLPGGREGVLWRYKYAQELQQQLELTLDEIAEKFGCLVEQLRIKK